MTLRSLMVLSAYLSGEGYRVLQTENGEQAFEILASKPHLDMMITDFRLPGGISGVQIAEPAVKLQPELKVIFISGYTAGNSRDRQPDHPQSADPGRAVRSGCVATVQSGESLS